MIGYATATVTVTLNVWVCGGGNYIIITACVNFATYTERRRFGSCSETIARV